MPAYDLISFPSDDALAQAAAEKWLGGLASAKNETPVYVALSGGRVAKKFFTAVAARTRATGTGLGRVHFFWGDERCVPPTDAESNYLLARTCLFDPLDVPSEKIHRLRGEIAPALAASEAEAEIRSIVPLNSSGQPVLDLVFLGMGEDGHVASLFPGAPDEVVNSSSVYLPVVASKPPPQRITINFASIAAAKQVWVLASGAGKELALGESLAPDGKTPLARALRRREYTLIFTDIHPAAGK